MEHPIGSQESRGSEELKDKEDKDWQGSGIREKGKKKEKEKDGMRKELKGFGEFQVIRPGQVR